MGARTEQESIWLRDPRSAHGPAPGYDREQIAAAAVALADRGGLASVSMRKVGAAIGAGATSLYRYVTNRNELVELMVDAVIGEAVLPPRTADGPIADLVGLARELRHVYRRHPWMAAEATPPMLVGPRAVDLLEHGMHLLSPLNALPQAKLEAIAVLIGQVILVTRMEIDPFAASPHSHRDPTAHLSRMVTADRHPHLAESFGTPSATDAVEPDPLDRLLPRLLSGLLGPPVSLPSDSNDCVIHDRAARDRPATQA